MSHQAEVRADDVQREGSAARKHLAVIERVTGYQPPTCPWRAMYDPLVRELMEQVIPAVDAGIGAVVLGDNAPAKVVEGVTQFRRALEATRHDDRLRLEAERRTKAGQ